MTKDNTQKETARLYASIYGGIKRLNELGVSRAALVTLDIEKFPRIVVHGDAEIVKGLAHSDIKNHIKMTEHNSRCVTLPLVDPTPILQSVDATDRKRGLTEVLEVEMRPRKMFYDKRTPPAFWDDGIPYKSPYTDGMDGHIDRIVNDYQKYRDDRWKAIVTGEDTAKYDRTAEILADDNLRLSKKQREEKAKREEKRRIDEEALMNFDASATETEAEQGAPLPPPPSHTPIPAPRSPLPSIENLKSTHTTSTESMRTSAIPTNEPSASSSLAQTAFLLPPRVVQREKRLPSQTTIPPSRLIPVSAQVAYRRPAILPAHMQKNKTAGDPPGGSPLSLPPPSSPQEPPAKQQRTGPSFDVDGACLLPAPTKFVPPTKGTNVRVRIVENGYTKCFAICSASTTVEAMLKTVKINADSYARFLHGNCSLSRKTAYRKTPSVINSMARGDELYLEIESIE